MTENNAEQIEFTPEEAGMAATQEEIDRLKNENEYLKRRVLTLRAYLNRMLREKDEKPRSRGRKPAPTKAKEDA